MNKAYLKAVAYYLPELIVSNQEIVAEFPEWTVDKIAAKVGVETRHLANKDETASDLAVKAAERLFNDYPEVDKKDIDFVLLCTQSPDYFLPSSSCILQHRLGLSSNCGAFDFNLGCSGYIYGLAIAKGLIAGGIAKNVLLLTAETYSKYLHPRDKGNRTIFGDAATASIIAREGFAEIGEFALGTDGSGAENLIVRNGAARSAKTDGETVYDENGNPASSNHLFMNGGEIFSFTQKNVPIVTRETLSLNGIEQEDVNLFIFHQANRYMLEFLRKKIKIPAEKFIVDMSDTGNTVSNSIPIVLARLHRHNSLHGSILLCGFGVGYSWGGCVLNCK